MENSVAKKCSTVFTTTDFWLTLIKNSRNQQKYSQRLSPLIRIIVSVEIKACEIITKIYHKMHGHYFYNMFIVISSLLIG